MLFKGKQNHNPSLRTHTLLDTHTHRKTAVSVIICFRLENSVPWEQPKVEVQNRRNRTLKQAQQGKQVFSNNKESSLNRAYVKAQNHETYGNNKKNDEVQWGKEQGQESQKRVTRMAHASSQTLSTVEKDPTSVFICDEQSLLGMGTCRSIRLRRQQER